MNIFRAEAGAIGFDEESTNRAWVVGIDGVVSLSPNHGDIGNRSRCDPHLLAIQHVLVSDLTRSCSHAAGVRSEVRFSEAEAAEFLAFLHRGQPGLFLLVA